MNLLVRLRNFSLMDALLAVLCLSPLLFLPFKIADNIRLYAQTKGRDEGTRLQERFAPLREVVGPCALLGYFLLADAEALIPYALALSAASFLYIAFGDLLPRIHSQTDRRQRQGQYLMLALGMAGIALLRLHHG